MRFRPCIDIHNGKVKQIVGGSLKDEGDQAKQNFESEQDAAYYARLYKKDGLCGGHVILLNPPSSEYFEATKKQALEALNMYPGGLQIGGGITAENAREYLDAGASHVIVTSYVFKDGQIHWDNMKHLLDAVGKERIVIDLSCRKKEDGYYIVTDRWQKFTDVRLTVKVLEEIADYCDEFLVHGVDVEGKSSGIDEELAEILAEYACKSSWNDKEKKESFSRNKITYAGGIGSIEDLERFQKLTYGKVDFTIGSALDLFGGSLPYERIKYYESEVNTL